MRTTVTLDDDVYEAARKMSESSGERLGKILSDLARQSMRRANAKDRFATFTVPDGAPPITAERVQQALDNDGHF